MRWQDFAACRGMDPGIFYPERWETIETARRVCGTCPVAGDCLEFGLMDRHGVWGGLSEKERRSVRHKRRVDA